MESVEEVAPSRARLDCEDATGVEGAAPPRGLRRGDQLWAWRRRAAASKRREVDGEDAAKICARKETPRVQKDLDC
jgi:hypothetical protein